MAIGPVPAAVSGETLATFDTGRLAFFGALARRADNTTFTRCLAELRRVEWVVYAERPFAGPAAVLNYLGGRYVAIANSWFVALAGGQVSFPRRDYPPDRIPDVLFCLTSKLLKTN